MKKAILDKRHACSERGVALIPSEVGHHTSWYFGAFMQMTRVSRGRICQKGEYALTDWIPDDDRGLGDLPVQGGHTIGSFNRNVFDGANRSLGMGIANTNAPFRRGV